MSTVVFDNTAARASYGVGLQIGQQLRESGLAELNTDAVLAGVRDALAGNPPAVPVDQIHQALREMQEKSSQQLQQQSQQVIEQGKAYLEQHRQQEGVHTTESGLQYRVLQQGNGPTPSRQDTVTVHYVGRFIDGKEFDSSIKHGRPAQFPVSGVIPGWTEALTMMPVGSKWELVVPYQLAYGERGAGSAIPPFSTLVFEVELLSIQ